MSQYEEKVAHPFVSCDVCADGRALLSSDNYICLTYPIPHLFHRLLWSLKSLNILTCAVSKLCFYISCALFLSLSFITCLYNVLSFSLFSHIMFLSFLFIKLSHFLIFSHSMLLRVFLPCFFWWICSKKPSSFYSRVVCPKLIFQFCFILPLFWNLSLVCFIHVFLPNFYIFSYLALYLHLSVMTVRASLFTCINISVFVCIYLNFSLPVFIFLLTWFCIFSYLALYLHLSVITCLAVQGSLLTTTAPPQATQQQLEKKRQK